jgi:gamma-glutamyltranspeptidase/glutathione hydrolase
MESRIPLRSREELASEGHQIQLLGPYSSTVGGGQAVLRDFSTGVNVGASDPRKDGEAIAELP